MRHNVFKVFEDIIALLIIRPTSKLPVLVDATALQHELAVLKVYTEALRMPGKRPGTRGNGPLRHIVGILLPRMWLAPR